MNNGERYYKIGEFAKAIGKSENTLREWEKVGKLVPQRTQGNHRVYSETQRIKILQEELERKKILSGEYAIDNIVDANNSKMDEAFEFTTYSNEFNNFDTDEIIERDASLTEFILDKDEVLNKLKVDRKIVAYARTSKESAEEMGYQIKLLKVYMIAKGYSFQIYKDIGNGINFENTELERLLDSVTNGEVEKIIVLSNDIFSKFNSGIIEMLCRSFNTEIEVIDKTPEIDIEKLNKEALDFIESLNVD